MRLMTLLSLSIYLAGCGQLGTGTFTSSLTHAGAGASSGSSSGSNTSNNNGADDDDSSSHSPKSLLETVLLDKGKDWRHFHYEDYQIEPYEMFVQPAWETSTGSMAKQYGEDFTQYAALILDQAAPDLLKGFPQLTTEYKMCPKYNSLSRAQKINFWVYFLSEVTRYESGFNPLSRYFESTFGYLDELTGEKVYSEGLLQLSYQDAQSYKTECGAVFDWTNDKKLDREDARKTILNPFRNLYCGIRIMNKIVKSNQKIYFDKNHYWAVLKSGGSYGKVTQINAALKKVSFCQ